MRLPVMAIAAMQLFTVALATLATRSDSQPGYTGLEPYELDCGGRSITDLDSLQKSLHSLVVSESRAWSIGMRPGVLAGTYFQVVCDDNNAILYRHNPLNLSYPIFDGMSVMVDYSEVVAAAKYIIDNCTISTDTGNGGGIRGVSGELKLRRGLASVVLARRKCSHEDELKDGISPKGPFVVASDDPPSSSAATAPKHSTTASEAASTTSSHSTKTSKPKPEKTASPEPPTTTHEAPKTNIKGPTDMGWGTTTCFQTFAERRVFSYKIVQDNIDWIAANVKTVPRNPGKGNCTRLACHRNSAIFFCNDDGDMHKPLDSPDQVLDGARRVVERCRAEGTKNSTEDVREEYFDLIAGEINHNDNWRVVVQSSLCKTQEQGDQVTALIAPVGTNPKTTQSDKDKSTKSNKATKSSPRTIIDKALDFLRPRTRDDSLTILGAMRAAKSCSTPDNTHRRVVRRDPPPGYQAHYCWGTLKNVSFPSSIEAGIQYLNKVPGRPGIDGDRCDQVSCSWDTAISWCSANSGRFELDTFKQIAAGAQFILDSCDVPADKCWVGHDISGRVYFKDNWSVIVSASNEHC